MYPALLSLLVSKPVLPGDSRKPIAGLVLANETAKLSSSVLEMHAFVAHTVAKFELLPGPVDLDSVQEQFGDVVAPSVEGAEGLPLKIRPITK